MIYEDIQVDNTTLLDFIKYMFGEDMESMSFGNMFHIVADSILTTFLLFFIAAWILSICVDLGKKGWK